MQPSEKGFLERVADAIPGLKGYRAKESRRDTDKRLREYVAAEIDRIRRLLDPCKRDLIAMGNLAPLDDLDRVVRKLQRGADAVRFATYGYSGFFDSVKVREEELGRIYAFDSELLGRVRTLEERVAAVVGGGPDSVPALEPEVDGFLEQVERRKRLFDVPE